MDFGQERNRDTEGLGDGGGQLQQLLSDSRLHGRSGSGVQRGIACAGSADDADDSSVADGSSGHVGAGCRVRFSSITAEIEPDESVEAWPKAFACRSFEPD